MVTRGQVIGGVLLAMAVLSTVVLWDVLPTVLFAITVAYVLTPLRRQFRKRGYSKRVSSVATTIVAVIGLLIALAPIVLLLVVRFNDVIAVLETLPDELTVEFAGFAYTLVLADLFDIAIGWLSSVGATVAAEIPVLLIKLALFILLVFGLLQNERNIQQAILGIVPPAYRDVAEALAERARETLFAIYVLQAATAVGTFLIALPIFLAFGYQSPVALATIAGILQFIPIVGPTVLIGILAIAHVVAGELLSAIAIVVIGGAFISWLPDLAIRPRLAAYTADLDGSLYFIGFVGGLLTVGAIGVIVGPLVVALLAEAAKIAKQEYNPAVESTASVSDSEDSEDDLSDRGREEGFDEASDNKDDRQSDENAVDKS